MPFAVSKTVTSMVASTMIGASGDYGVVEQVVPIEQKFFEPVVERQCEQRTVRRNNWWRGTYYERINECWDQVYRVEKIRVIGHYVVYNDNGKRITVEELL